MKIRWDILLNPLYLGMLFLLFLNDFILKLTFPGFVTGKLSDFAGVFVFTIFWMVIFPRWKYLVAILSACWFVYWKSPFSQSLIDAFNQYSFYEIYRVVDYSDLFALIVIPFSLLYFKSDKISENNIHLIKRIGVLGCSLFLFCSTSRHYPTPAYGSTYIHQTTFQSKKKWKTTYSIQELEKIFHQIAKTVQSNPSKTQWEINDIYIDNDFVFDVSLTTRPLRKKTEITVYRYYFCYNSLKNIDEKKLNKQFRQKLKIVE